MRPCSRREGRALAVSLGALLSALSASVGCARPASTRDHAVASPAAAPGVGLVLREADGERRFRRPQAGAPLRALSAPIIFKVDGTNGGSGQDRKSTRLNSSRC